jgi:hypothetical protein
MPYGRKIQQRKWRVRIVEGRKRIGRARPEGPDVDAREGGVPSGIARRRRSHSAATIWRANPIIPAPRSWHRAARLRTEPDDEPVFATRREPPQELAGRNVRVQILEERHPASPSFAASRSRRQRIRPSSTRRASYSDSPQSTSDASPSQPSMSSPPSAFATNAGLAGDRNGLSYCQMLWMGRDYRTQWASSG